MTLNAFCRSESQLQVRLLERIKNITHQDSIAGWVQPWTIEP